MNGVQDWAAVLVGLGIGGVLVEAVRFVLHRKGMDADAAKTVTDAAIGLVTPLKDRVRELEADLTVTEERASELDTDLKAATATVITLTQQVVGLTAALEACHAELAEFRRMLGPHAPD